jgi:hypothetical protein
LQGIFRNRKQYYFKRPIAWPCYAFGSVASYTSPILSHFPPVRPLV